MYTHICIYVYTYKHIYIYIYIYIHKLPYLNSTMLCSKLSKGMGHTYYGEPAWPNDILYIFPAKLNNK